MVEKINYFELKYLTLESYFQCVIDEKYTHGQSTGRTLYEHKSQITNSLIELIVIYSSTFSILSQYDFNSLINYQKEIEEMNRSLKDINVLDYITEEEYEYLEEDVYNINSRLSDILNKAQ